MRSWIVLGAVMLVTASAVQAQSIDDPRDLRITASDMHGNYTGRQWWKSFYQCWAWHSLFRPDYTRTATDSAKARLFKLAADARLTKDRDAPGDPVLEAYFNGRMAQDVTRQHGSFKQVAALQDKPESESALYFDTYCDQLLAAHARLS